MTTVGSYPHYRINVKDASIGAAVVQEESLPLFRPMFLMRAEKGAVGVPVWCSQASVAMRNFGPKTFDPLNSTYFSPAAFFANNVFQSTGCFIVRVADADAENADRVLEAAFEKKDVRVVVAEEDGTYSHHESSVVSGIEITLKVRALNKVTETADTIQPVLVTDPETDEVISGTYPLFVFAAGTPGAWGNDTAFRIYTDIGDNTSARVLDNGARYYRFSPLSKPNGSNTLEIAPDKYANQYNLVCMKPNQYDPQTTAAQSFDLVLANAFPETTPLPFQITPYFESFKALGVLCAEFMTNAELGGVTDAEKTAMGDDVGYLVDCLTSKTITGVPYAKVYVTGTVSTDSGTTHVNMTSTTNHYLAGGADGLMTDTVVQNGVVNFLNGTTYPQIVDKARHPITHVIDVGYDLVTKKAMLDFTTLRDDVKAIMSTQQIMGSWTLNSQATDESMLTTLRNYALLQLESTLRGTEACRATILMQAGRIGTAKQWWPASLWLTVKKAQYLNGDKMAEEPKGRPNSEETLFSEVNWIPHSEMLKETKWAAGGNYSQFFSMTGRHYASLRSVYPWDTSVLVDDSFTDALVFTKHEVRQSWSKFAGVTMPALIIQDRIKKDILSRLEYIYNGKYTVNVVVGQTADEVQLGYVQHVYIEITSPATNRVWQVDIICKREGIEEGV